MDRQDKNQAVQVNFRLKNIELIETCIHPPRKKLPKDTIFQFDINIDHRVSAGREDVYAICSVVVLDNTKDHVFAKITAGCIFQAQELSSFLDEKDKRLILPEFFITTINSITISTLRGIMFSFFRGTYLHNALLPVIDPLQLSQVKK